MWEEVDGPGGVRALGGGDASGMCTGRARLKAWGPGHERGAHREHGAHGRDAGRVEAERLVERLRVLPRVERRACGARRGTAQEV